MAEALGLASGVIAVVDITVKAGSTYVKLTRLWDEVKQVPETLRAQTEEIRDLEDYLLDVETDFATSPLPEFAPSRTLLERHIMKCRLALDELKDAVDDVYAQVTNTRGFRSKIAATKAALRKDDLKILTSKFDRALKLFQLAQAQERRWIAVATFTAMVDANNRERLPETPSGTLKRLPKKKATALPSVYAGSSWPNILGRFHLGHSRNGSFQLSFQAPTWLTQSVYSLLAQRESRGWQVNLRASEVVESFSWQLFCLIARDEVTAVSKYLSEQKMTPFTRERNGYSMLMLASLVDALEVTKLLLQYDFEDFAAELFDRSKIPWLFSILSSPYHKFETLLLLEDSGLSEYLSTITPDDFQKAFFAGISPGSYQALLDKSGLQNEWLSISERLCGALSVIVSTIGTPWRMHDLCFLLPEILSPEGLAEILELSKGIRKGSLLHTLAIGMALVSMTEANHDTFTEDAGEEEEEEEKRWVRTLLACIEAAPMTLHHPEMIYLGASETFVECTPLAAIITRLVEQSKWAMRRPKLSTKQSLVNIRAAFRLWIETVAAAGVDLLLYGREEMRLQKGHSRIQQRVCPRIHEFEGGRIRHKFDSRASILGITYGSLPSQWELWIVDHDYEYVAGEFWEMIEAQQFSIPGDWVDPVDEWEETDRWLRETPSPLIWSEYRKIRPPI